MLKQLDYSVTFTKTGRTLSEAVLFQGGFGAIVGPNESGKSMILEMIRFCLFGSAALRGKADSYSGLKASLSWDMKGSDYRVERTANKATLYKDGAPVAVGTTPVNQKIPAELGFGMAVFDMTCVANQNQLLKLGEMRPAERQRAVDSVIGVSVLDDLAKFAGDEALALKRAADDLSANLHEPVEPKEPDGYENSGNLEEHKQALDQVRSQADQLRGWLANVKPKPEEPVRKHTLDAATLQSLIDAQTETRIKLQTLQNELNRIPPAANVTLEEIEEDERRQAENERYLARKKFLSQTPPPDLNQEQITTIRKAWQAHQNWGRYQHMVKQRNGLLSKGEHICPSCSHHWPVAGEVVDTLAEEILQFATDNVLLEDKPSTTEAELDRQQRLLDGWSEEEWAKHADAPTEPVDYQWTVQDRIRHRHGLEGRARRAELQAQIAAIAVDTTDHASHLRLAQQYDVQMQVFHEKVAEYEAWLVERDDKQIQLDLLQTQLVGYDDLVRRIREANLYENQMLAYSVAFGRYNEGCIKVASYRVEADDWNKVKDALKILRLKIKQHLVPSLNRVASQLIAAMTGGQRQNISVDEEFNILVDNQEIDTLSGSGGAVANLALRLALGQVLTNNVFSLFMGDEIDASMDKDRASKTSEVLYTLKGRISQLLLVSHKFPAADYYIAVGENIEQLIHAD
jgi:DNA repair exonuclease SbcCD ATPase subunit